MELSLRPATFCRRTRIAPIATETMVTDRSGPALAQCTMRGKATAIYRLRRSQAGRERKTRSWKRSRSAAPDQLSSILPSPPLSTSRSPSIQSTCNGGIMQRKVMISCAVTGSADTPGRNPAVPVTPRQIADSAIDAAKASCAAPLPARPRQWRTAARSLA